MVFQSLNEALLKHDLALTEPRRIIFSILKNSGRPLSAKEILKQVTFTDRATVYRTLATFESAKIISQVPIVGEALYELSDSFEDHHHHMYCASCDDIIPFASKDIEKAISKAAKKARFRLQTHDIVLHGMCESCQQED